MIVLIVGILLLIFGENSCQNEHPKGFLAETEKADNIWLRIRGCGVEVFKDFKNTVKYHQETY